MKTTIISIALLFLVSAGFAQSIPPGSLYFGQTPPGDSGIVFAPGIIPRDVPCITFSSDGKSAFFYIEFWPNPGTPFTMFTEYKNGKWTTPDTAEFTKNRMTSEPFFALNDSRIYLNAKKALNQVSPLDDLSYVEKRGSAWSDPISLGKPPNLLQDQYHPCIVADTSIYFSASNGEICRCQYKNGVYKERVILPYPINNANTGQTWGDPFVAKDESYLIFKSTRVGGYGQNDIYISYRKADGTWTNPKNLGSKINTRYNEASGDITPDGKYMTYGSDKSMYWVSAGFIEKLRHTNFIPYLKNKIKDQTGSVGHSFSFIIPDGAFIDDDGNSTLTYSATLSNGNPLPSWLSFNPNTMTFSGTPIEADKYNIKVTATDTEKASDSCTFSIIISAKPK